VLSDDGRAVVDRVGAGRGAWLCVPPGDCFQRAVRRKAFERAWRRPVSSDALDRLGTELAALAGTAGDGVRRDDEKG
jgi:predicted RNA-binding protein YlxR (DUF448 family)